MNRLHQLKQTLPQNIIDNADYFNLEFIVLDYGSQDNMEEWIRKNMNDHIETGRLIYYKTTEPNTWSPSHSKNIAFKLATGDVVCNIWADYYTGKDFASYVNTAFKRDSNIVLTPIDFPKTRNDYHPPGDVLGKVCVRKVDFEKICGFDERMDKHGFEDYDFINRLEMTGVKRVLIENPEYWKYISHKNSERYLLPTDNLKAFYLSYQTPIKSEVLFLYKDQSFEKGILVDNFAKDADNYIYAYTRRIEHFKYGLQKPGWQKGTWIVHCNSIKLLRSDAEEQTFICHQQNDNKLLIDVVKQSVYYNFTNESVINEMLTFKHYMYTRSIMEENIADNKAIITKEFGKAIIHKNFSPETIII